MPLDNKFRALEVYAKHWASGTYLCARCDRPLFRSADKFHSGTPWPCFRRAIRDAVITRPDHSHGLNRTELLCAHCGLHLGHVFDDGLLCGDTHPCAGWRYCILSAALCFRPRGRKAIP